MVDHRQAGIWEERRKGLVGWGEVFGATVGVCDISRLIKMVVFDDENDDGDIWFLDLVYNGCFVFGLMGAWSHYQL